MIRLLYEVVDAGVSTWYDLDVDQSEVIRVDKQLMDYKDPAARMADFSQTFTLPSTDRNSIFFDMFWDPTFVGFDYSPYILVSCELYEGTDLIIKGNLQLIGIDRTKPFYLVRVFGSLNSLKEVLGDKTLAELGWAEYNHIFSGDNVRGSWDLAVQTGGLDSTSKIVISVESNDNKMTFDNITFEAKGTATMKFHIAYAGLADLSDAVLLATSVQLTTGYTLFSYDFDFDRKKKQAIYIVIVPFGANNTTEEFSIQSNTFKLNGSKGALQWPLASDYTTFNLIDKVKDPTYSDGTMTEQTISGGGVWQDIDQDPNLGVTDKILYPLADWGKGYGYNGFDVTNNNNPIHINDLYPSINYLTLIEGIFQKNGMTLDLVWPVTWLDKIYYQLNVDKEKSVKRQDIYFFAARQVNQPIAVNATVIIELSAVSNPTGTWDDNTFSANIKFDGNYSFQYIIKAGWTGNSTNQNVVSVVGVYKNGTLLSGSDSSVVSTAESGDVSISFTTPDYALVDGDIIDIRIDMSPIGSVVTSQVSSSSSFEINSAPNILVGGTVIVSNAMGDIKQVDVIRDFLNHWNLILIQDPDIKKTAIVMPYDDWIAMGKVLDYSDKLDISKPVIIKPATEWMKAEINYSFKKTPDDLNQRYQDATGKTYGAGVLATGIAYTTSQQGIFSIMAPYPTSIVQGTAMRMARYYKDQENPALERIAPQIFFYNGKLPSGDWWLDDEESVVKHTDYPNTSNFLYNASAKVDETSQDLNFLFSFPFDGSTLVDGITNLNAYEQYHQKYNRRLYREDSRIIECNLFLNPSEFQQLGLNDEIRLTFNGSTDAYYLMKVTGFALGIQNSTKVTLLKK